MNQVLLRASQFVEANNQYKITTDKFWTYPIQYVQRSTLNSLSLQTDDIIRCERQRTPEFNISLCTLDDHISCNGSWSERWIYAYQSKLNFFFFFLHVSLSSRWLSHCIHCMPARNQPKDTGQKYLLPRRLSMVHFLLIFYFHNTTVRYIFATHAVLLLTKPLYTSHFHKALMRLQCRRAAIWLLNESKLRGAIFKTFLSATSLELFDPLAQITLSAETNPKTFSLCSCCFQQTEIPSFRDKHVSSFRA